MKDLPPMTLTLGSLLLMTCNIIVFIFGIYCCVTGCNILTNNKLCYNIVIIVTNCGKIDQIGASQVFDSEFL